jgi:hypothetical protein
MKLFDDKQFLSAIHGYERQLAKLLAVLLAAVVGFAALELVVETGIGLVQRQTNWFDGSLIKLLVQIELVLLTALTAVARKVIVLPPGTENKPALMAGFGVIVVGLAAAYWLVRWARRGDQQPAR